MKARTIQAEENWIPEELPPYGCHIDTPYVVVLAFAHGGGRVVGRILYELGARGGQLKRSTLENADILKGWPHNLFSVVDSWRGTVKFIKNGEAMVHIPQIEEELGPNVKYIYVTRDGRDLAFHPAFLNNAPYSPESTALLWKKYNLAALRDAPEDRTLRFKLEDLIRCPNHEAAKICKFLGTRNREIAEWIYKPKKVGHHLKYRDQDALKVQRGKISYNYDLVTEVANPALIALGYL
jgi:hypothetical protein